MKRLLYVLTCLCLLAGVFTGCEKPEKENKQPFEPIEPELQEDYTETAFGMDIEMVYVKGGEFMMGYTEDQELDWLPDSTINKYLRKTKLDSYHIGRFEVTQEQWKKVMGTTLEEQWTRWIGRGEFPSTYNRRGDTYPMYYVGWEEAQEFCKKLSEQTGKKYVLPTSAQWEYAARGGVHKTKTKYAGSNDIEEVAWYNENSENLGVDHPDYGVHKVGSKKANALGIYDMSGNVWEWCLDKGDKYKGYDKTDDYNPQGPEKGWEYVYRGGGCGDNEIYCRVGVFREQIGYGWGAHVAYGFRVACIAD